MSVLKINKRANFDYTILETFVAGVALKGWEVKSIKQGNVSLKESFVRVRNREAFLINTHVSPYQNEASTEDVTRRTRKLLLQKRELDHLEKKIQSGLTVVPIKFFTQRGLIKLEIGLAQGRKKYDKREMLKRKAIKRDIEVAVKERYK